MRVYSNSQSWLDLNGDPLVGRVTFYKFHTTTPEVITDVNGTPLANPVFTNQIGQLIHDVFLKNDTDYTVYFEKYIGNASMENDPDNWQFQYSSDNIFTEYVLDIQSEALQEVNNINDLRALSPLDVLVRDGHKIIRLLGYNEAGDKPEVIYKYDDASIEADNGGSVIKPNDESIGRWILVNTFDTTNGIDVRHLGVFGTYIREAADTMSAQISVANNYATSVGIPLYFPRLDEGTTWYKMNNLNIKAMFADGTRVYSKTGSHTYITMAKDVDNLSVYTDATYNGEFTIYGNVVRSSYGVLSNNVHFAPTETFVFDSIISTVYKTMANVAVKTDRVIYDWTFDACTFDGVIGHMGSRNTFTNCRLTQLMFTNGFADCVVNDTDIVDIDDWNNLKKWWTLRKQLSSRDLDLHNRTISNLNVDLSDWTFCIVYNATFDNYVVHDEMTSIGFRNCLGTVSFTATHMTISFDDCNMTVGFAAGNYDSLAVNDSTLAVSTIAAIGAVGIYDSTITGSYLLQSPAITIKRSDVSMAIDATQIVAETSTLGAINAKVPSITRCILNGPISQASTEAVVNFLLDGNTFREGSYHTISSTVPNTVVNGIWINNVSLLATHFIVLDRTNLDTNEQHHGYVYENNSGPHTLQKLSAKWNDTLTLYNANGQTPVMDCKQVFWQPLGSGGFTASRCQTITDQDGNQVIDPNIWLTELEFFSVGTDPNYLPNFRLIVTPVRRLYNATNQMYHFLCGNTTSVDALVLPTQTVTTTALPGILFVGNYKWRLYKVFELFDEFTPFWTSSDASKIWNIQVGYELEPACPQSWGTQVTI